MKHAVVAVLVTIPLKQQYYPMVLSPGNANLCIPQSLNYKFYIATLHYTAVKIFVCFPAPCHYFC